MNYSEKNEFEKQVFESSPMPIVIMDAITHQYIDCNPAAVKIYRYNSKEDLLGKSPLDFSASTQYDGSKSSEKAVYYIQKALQEGSTIFEWKHQRPDGEIWDAEVHLLAFKLKEKQLLQFSLIDITERKRQNEALEKRILALIQPMENPKEIIFEDLFNIKDIQRLQDEFAEATGVASIITRPDGTPITNPSNFCYLCSHIIRKTEKGRMNCFHSDAILGRAGLGSATVQPCLSGGLWDAGAGITVEGRHIANWLIGQVRDETQTEDKMKNYARIIGADETAFLEAFRKVPAMSLSKFKNISEFLKDFQRYYKIFQKCFLRLQIIFLPLPIRTFKQPDLLRI